MSYTKRKSVFVHEVLHLIATLLSLTEIRLKTLKQRLIKKLKNKVTLITEELLTNLASAMRKRNIDNNAQKDFDKHFRLGWENFQGSYFTLFEELMLSKKEFETVFTENYKKDFKEYWKLKDRSNLLKLLYNVFETVSDKYHVDITFVYDRFFNKFINTYLT